MRATTTTVIRSANTEDGTHARAASTPPTPDTQPNTQQTHTHSAVGEDVAGGDGSGFVCERVCTSDRLLRRLGGLAREPTRNSCVTVCGVSSHDACVEACQRSVCSVPHQVPAWNEACLRRCTAECLKGRAG